MAVSGSWGCILQSKEEILASLKSFYYDLALSHDETNYTFMKVFAGADHLLFGTDFPNSGAQMLPKDLALFNKTKVFTNDEKEMICAGNYILFNDETR